MAEGLMMASLAALVGKKNAVRWGTRRATVGTVGVRGSERWIMATLSDGTVVLGEPGDFTIPKPRVKQHD